MAFDTGDSIFVFYRAVTFPSPLLYGRRGGTVIVETRIGGEYMLEWDGKEQERMKEELFRRAMAKGRAKARAKGFDEEAVRVYAEAYAEAYVEAYVENC